jgi:threonine dehydrogenase-like Zn-dependent dehydrogenase
MNDQELRALVRDAVARHLGTPGSAASARPRADPSPALHTAHAGIGHASHAIYLTVVNPGEACVIEPSVPCDHCGYCKSHGH